MAGEIAKGLQATEPGRRATFRIAAGIAADGDATLLWVVLNNLIGKAWEYPGKRDESQPGEGATFIFTQGKSRY